MIKVDQAAGSVLAARSIALIFSATVGVGAFSLFLQAGAEDGLHWIDVLRSTLILVSTWWLAWGAAGALLGLPGRRFGVTPPAATDLPPGRTAILVPVCNEDPVATFARIAAMDVSLHHEGLADHVDFAVLSDTSNPDIAGQEQHWFARLVTERNGQGRMFYRRRTVNTGRKAGNIEDFIKTSGARYDYAVILDADSLIEGGTIGEMIRRIAAQPDLGLLQTLPKVIAAQSVFGRAMQFSASFYSPVFARGQARMQGRTGPFWGHNAIIRVRAFAESCGLPVLRGDPPFGGHILSHDYVEAALLARAGWRVRLDEDIEGSFEDGPENIVSYAKRDRRWCQGNLQHARLLAAPRLKFWSRFVFLQGILAYLSSLLWGMFLIFSVLATVTAPAPDYFPEPYQLFPVFPGDRTKEIIGLAIGIVGLLVLPKFLILGQAIATGRARGFGGAMTALASSLAELVLSSITAPVMLMYQSRAVLQVLLGRDGGWPTNQRGEGRLTIRQGWVASRWIVATGALVLATTLKFAPGLVIWLLPICLPMLLSPLLIALTSRPLSGPLFAVPSETAPVDVITTYHKILARWTGAVSHTQAAPGAMPSPA